MLSSNSVFDLPALAEWTYPGTTLAVLGYPIKHSLSPAMHNGALEAIAQSNPWFREWKYVRCEVPPAELPRALDLLHKKKFRGLNLTMPHKVIAFEQMTEVDPSARRAGAVNTLHWTERGWHGFNTDGYGLSTGIRETLGLGLAERHVVLLGAGGAGRGAAVEALENHCASLSIGNRTAENLNALLHFLEPLARGIPMRGFDLSAPPDLPADALIINATSSGLTASAPAPVDLTRFSRPAAVYDMIYNPPRTALLRQAETLAIPCANGLTMLVHQGAKALEIWTGIAAAETAPTMLVAARAALKNSPS